MPSDTKEQHLKKTPLYEKHVALGAKMTDFNGWAMPLQYGGILAEHLAVRENCGVFDVSHMGEIAVSGDGAEQFLQTLLTHDIRRLAKARWIYSPMCNPDGGTVDDVIVYRQGDGYLVCVNAGNTDKDFAWMRLNAPSGVIVTDLSAHFSQIAVQGPKTEEILAKTDTSEAMLIAKTGYTGERGVEIYLSPEDAPSLWDQLIEAGATPCGLGARDTLRTEAGLPLYGHELSKDISPLEAGLTRFISFDKGPFIGRDELFLQSHDENRRRLVGLTMGGRSIPRPGYAVLCGGAPCGSVTSGGPSPTLGAGIAMALVTKDADEYEVLIRGKAEPASRTELPFYRRRI